MKNRAAFYVVLAALAAVAAWMLLPFFGPIMMAALVGVSQQAPAALREDKLVGIISDANVAIDRLLNRHVPITENLAVYTEHVRAATMHAAPEIIGHIGRTALDLVIFLYVLFFVFTEGREAFQTFIDLVPLDVKLKPLLAQTIESTMTGVLYGQVITAAVIAVAGAIGYAAVGLPHLLLWTLLTLIAAMLPVLGGAVVWAPLAASRLLAGHAAAGWGLVAY